MPRKRTPKVVGVRRKSTFVPVRNTYPKYEHRQKTKREQIYDIIYDACVHGYHFTDTLYGMPLINLEDLEEKENDLYIIRFRCVPHYLHEVYFGRMAKEVCDALKSGLHFIHELKKEWGIPFEECVWVLKVGEIEEQPPIWRKIFMTNNKTQEQETKPHPRKCTHERWEEFLQKNYDRSLLSVAQELGYSEQNTDILGCDPSNIPEKKRIYKKHKKLFDSFLKDEWNKALVDGRNVLDYFKDLISSWIGEDLLVKALNEYGFNAILANADRDRVIKTERRQVTGEPDIKIEYEGNVRYLELMDALSPVEQYGQFDLRLSKAKNQYYRKTLFLLHGLADNKFILIDFMRDNVTVTYNYPNPRFGNKPCSVVRFEDNGIKMHDMSILWETIKDVMCNSNPEPVHFLKMMDFESGKEEIIRNEEEKEIEDESSSDEIQNSQESYDINDSEISQVEESSVDEESSDTQEIQIPEVSEQSSFEVEPNYGKDEVIEQEESDESSIIEEDESGQKIEYTPEQWAALNDGF